MQTLLNFIEPSLLGAFVDLLIKAFEKRVCKGSASLWRECQCVLQKVGGIFPHTNYYMAIGMRRPERYL